MEALLESIVRDHGIDPTVWAVLYFGKGPFIWYSWFRIGALVLQRNLRATIPWFMVWGIALCVPWIYVLAFGRNLPFWLSPLLALALLFSIRVVWMRFQSLQQG